MHRACPRLTGKMITLAGYSSIFDTPVLIHILIGTILTQNTVSQEQKYKNMLPIFWKSYGMIELSKSDLVFLNSFSMERNGQRTGMKSLNLSQTIAVILDSYYFMFTLAKMFIEDL